MTSRHRKVIAGIVVAGCLGSSAAASAATAAPYHAASHNAVKTGNISSGTPQKPGYFITASDEFNVAGSTLTPSLWNDRYLPHWTPEDTSANYEISGGTLKLKITPQDTSWDPAHDDQTVISGIQTAEKDWLHRWTNYSGIDHSEPTALQHIQKYGYFEIRAKAQTGGGIHSAWWMIGAQQDQNPGSRETGEIDIFEIPGKTPNITKFNWIPWGDPQPFEAYDVNQGVDLSAGFHTYGFEWTPSSVKLYVDGVLTKTINKSPNYPMLTLLGLYEKRHGGWTGPFDPSVPYPKTFEIDYWRAYQTLPTFPYTVQGEDMNIYGAAKSASLTGASNNKALRFLGNGTANRATFEQLYSPDSRTRPLTIRYVSGENRSLTYRVNGGSPVSVALNSGGWSTFATQTVNIPVNAGLNTIEFYNTSGWAPDVDSITLG